VNPPTYKLPRFLSTLLTLQPLATITTSPTTPGGASPFIFLLDPHFLLVDKVLEKFVVIKKSSACAVPSVPLIGMFEVAFTFVDELTAHQAHHQRLFGKWNIFWANRLELIKWVVIFQIASANAQPTSLLAVEHVAAQPRFRMRGFFGHRIVLFHVQGLSSHWG
jgi:hypothetical protein